MADRAMSDDPYLNPTQAAHFLGITPELLFSYVRNAPKSALGHDRRLTSYQSDGQTVFLRADLESFDRYLHEPWSKTADDRPAIPTYISEYLKVECGGQCARCGKGFKLEMAHIDDYAKSLSHHHHNLIRLCSSCHDEFDAKKIIPAGQLKTLKQRLIATLRERIASTDSHLRTLTQSVPTPTRRFVGRTSELDQLKAALTKRRTITVHGAAGIGKTELVLNALSALPRDCEIVWLDITAFANVSDIEVYVRSALRGSAPANLGSIGNLLDQRHRCVVFDGVEAITPAKLDALEDWFTGLIGATQSTIIVFTSQTPLHNVDVDLSIDLGPLNSAESLGILEPALTEIGALQDGSSITDPDGSISWLLGFSDGHVLTLKLVSGLLRYFGSTSTVAERIQRFGTPALNNPTRGTQTKSTSLAVALSLAYSFVGPEEQHLAYIISQCPAGLHTAYLEFFGILDADASIAALRRWHLLTVEPYGLGRRLTLLSPVRAFVEESYERDQPEAAANAFLELTRSLTLQALVLSHNHIQTDDIAYGVLRFSHEFSNFLHVFYKAYERKEEHREYLESLGALATSMQVFCFVSGVWSRGAEIMRIGAEASKRVGMHPSASGLLLQALMLLTRTQRYEHQQLVDLVQEISDITEQDDRPHLRGNAAMAKGQLLQEEGNLNEAYEEFKTAERLYKEAQSEAPPETGLDDDRHMLALALMGQAFALEHTERPSDALVVYEQAAVLMRQDNDALNLGSVLHQTGNCHDRLHEHGKALDAYLSAAQIFASIGVRGHLSNSVTEIGYVLFVWQPEIDIRSHLTIALLEACIDDVIVEVADCFLSRLPNKLDDRACLRAIRKIVGLIGVFSYLPDRPLLEVFAEALQEQIVRPIITTLEPVSSRPRSFDDILIMYVDVITALCGSIRACRLPKPDRAALGEIEHLARLCYRLFEHGWAAFRVFEWLSMYTRRCYGLTLSADEINAAIEESEEYGAAFTLEGFEL